MTEPLFGETESMFGDDRVDVLVRILHSLRGWPPDATADRALVGELMAKYPGKDLRQEFTKFVEYERKRKADSIKGVNYRGRLRTRFRNSDRWASQDRLRPTRRGGSRSGTGGAPAASGAFPRSGYVSW